MAGTREYTHLKLGEDVAAGIAGYYTPGQEVRLSYNGREVLYVLGSAVVEAACCGVGNWGYVLVPGYIVKWQHKKSEAGLPVSEVAPISDEKTRDNIKQIIQSKETVAQVQFW